MGLALFRQDLAVNIGQANQNCALIEKRIEGGVHPMNDCHDMSGVLGSIELGIGSREHYIAEMRIFRSTEIELCLYGGDVIAVLQIVGESENIDRVEIGTDTLSMLQSLDCDSRGSGRSTGRTSEISLNTIAPGDPPRRRRGSPRRHPLAR